MIKLLVNIMLICAFAWIAFLMVVPVIKVIFAIIAGIFSFLLPIVYTVVIIGLIFAFLAAPFK